MKLSLKWLSLGMVACWVSASAAVGYTTNIVRGAVWRYYDSEPCNVATNWLDPAFDDSGWSSGPGPLGYSTKEPPEHVFATTIGYGGDPLNIHPSCYYRHTFVVTNAHEIGVARLELRRDDAAVVYLNGIAIYTNNMAALPWSCTTYDGLRGSDGEYTWFQEFIDPAFLVEGTNLVAVEIHQQKADSSDSIFDFGFLTAPEIAPELVRGPYLQAGTPYATTVRWRTDVATDSRVRYGVAPGELTEGVQVAGARTEHIVVVTNLLPSSRYYYAIGSTAGDFAGDDTNHFFQTAPMPGSPKRTRIWAIGDSGTSAAYDKGDFTDGKWGYERSYDLYNQYRAYTSDRYTDIWLLLGDNAYPSGTDAQHQVGFFDKYPELLRQTVVWPSPGNHEYYNGATAAATESGPYFDIFTMPKAGEAGGVSSGSEAYFSFDFANIHFISLDSMGVNRGSGSTAWLNTNTAMYAWLELDLAATLQEWIVMFWHHPPYTKGSHNSDVEGDLIQMRQNFLPLLDAYGVDLVLNGHSHDYERSMLLKGHYGHSSTFDTNTMAMDSGDGRVDGDGAYSRAAATGTVYAVVGSSGKIGAFNNNLDHPVMVTSMWEHGSIVLDVADKRLDATFLDDEGNARDWFTLLHDQPQTDDSDEDSLPDWWERWHFGNLGQTGSGDKDDDGVSNVSEYLGGTDPDDPASYLKISTISRPSASNSVSLSWSAVPGQLYDVETCTNLLEAPAGWAATVHTNQKVPVSGVLQVSDAVSNGVQRFYRLSASPEIPW